MDREPGSSSASDGGAEPSPLEAQVSAVNAGPERKPRAYLRITNLAPRRADDSPAPIRAGIGAPELAAPDLAGLARRERLQYYWREIFRLRHLPVAVVLALYVLWYSHLSLSLFFGYGDPPFDLSVFNQGIWLLSHFHTPFVTVMGRNLFGDHTSFILLLVAPFYRLFPEPQGILVLQTLAIAGAGVPIYLLAQRYIKSTWIATVLVAAYLFNPALEQGNLDQFHPECLQVLIISIAIYAAVTSRKVLLVVMAGLALLVKEDAAMLVVPLGLWFAWRRDRLWGFGIAGVALVYAFFANVVILPAFLGAGSIYTGRIPFGGPGGLVSTFFHHPSEVVRYLHSGQRSFYIWQIAAPFAWVFLLAPEIAAIGILVVGENVLSNDGYMQQILYQYSMTLAPVLMMGTVYAIATIRRRQFQSALAVVVLAAAVWTCALWGLAPFSDDHVQGDWYSTSAFGHGVAYIEKGLPANAVVSAWYPIVSHIDQRTQVYVWPTPFSAEDWGIGTNVGARLPVASQVRYLILPVPLASDQNPDVMSKISSFFRLVRSEDGIGLYRRIGS